MTARDWSPIVRRAARRTVDDHMTLIAKALAFSAFLAIPSVGLVAVGLFTLFAEPDTIDRAIADLHEVIPVEVRSFLTDGLQHLERRPSSSLAITVIGFALALWSTTSAMTSYMTALDIAYHRTDGRGFVKRRAVALGLTACLGAAIVLVGALLIFGPIVERHVGRAIGHEQVVSYVWWTAQWPILAIGLLLAFAAMLYLGPDVDERDFRMATPGALAAAVIWLAASGGLALYTGYADTYNKAWGSLSTLIVVLLWLWLTSLALLFGAELDAEAQAM